MSRKYKMNDHMWDTSYKLAPAMGGPYAFNLGQIKKSYFEMADFNNLLENTPMMVRARKPLARACSSCFTLCKAAMLI